MDRKKYSDGHTTDEKTDSGDVVEWGLAGQWRCSGVGPFRSDQPGLTSEFGPDCHRGSTEVALTITLVGRS